MYDATVLFLEVISALTGNSRLLLFLSEVDFKSIKILLNQVNFAIGSNLDGGYTLL